MTVELRDYQDAAIDSVFEYFDNTVDKNPLIALPTGTGKSLVMAGFIEKALKVYPGTKIIVVTHVKELIAQNYKQMKRLWPQCPAGVYSAGLKRREHHMPVTFAGIGSVYRYPELFGKVDLVLIDEAHLVGENATAMYIKFLSALKKQNPKLKIAGLTATKFRIGMGVLTNGLIFDDICFDLTNLKGFNWLLGQGYLKPLVPKPATYEYDLAGVRTQQGEFILGDLQKAMDRDDLNIRACEEMIKYAAERHHWLVFASGVKHAIHIADILNQMGIASIAIHSEMGDEARDKAIEDFKAGIYECAVNNNILTTGFDFPEIDFIGCLRPTKSAGLWVQMLGRGTRPVYAEGFDLGSVYGRLEAMANGTAPNCLVLDFARNTLSLGPINDPVMPKKKGEGGGGTAPVKECPGCGAYVHASLTVCPHCGTEMPRALKIDYQASTEVLIKQEVIDPKLKDFEVDHVKYSIHKKPNRPDSLRVSYYAKGNMRRFDEWVCFEHQGYAWEKARRWWGMRSHTPMPASTLEAYNSIELLTVPNFVRVRIDSKFPEIVDYDLRPQHQAIADSFEPRDSIARENGSQQRAALLHQL
jgi:DNA repair protein RadD